MQLAHFHRRRRPLRHGGSDRRAASADSNRLSVGLALLGVVRLGLAIAAGAGAWSVAGDIAAALGVFALGALAFHLHLLGGGDVKLLAAGALWLGTGELGAFLTATVLAGGLLAVGFIAWQRVLPGWRYRTARVSLPYAIAIAAGGILATAAALMA